MADWGSSPSSDALLARRPGESWSYTGANYTKVSHRWIIDKFPLLCHSTSRNKLKSLSFTGGGPAEWHLELDTEYRIAERSKLQDRYFMRLSLHRDKPLPTEDTPVSAECKISILNSRGKRCEEKTGFFRSDLTFYLFDFDRASSVCTWAVNLIERNELLKTQAKELLVGDRLTILCELNILLSPSDSSTVMLPPVLPPSNNLGADLGSLLKGGQHSDVTLVAKWKEFRAHKCILSARSPVFEAMFQHSMREREEKKVVISDLSADTVQEMLQHIYTGEVSTLEQSAESLLEAADKYDLPLLKSACEGTLRSRLKVENAARLLMLADKHHADQLKAECMGVIIGHPQEVQKSEDWKVLKSERQDLLFEAGQSLFKRFAD